MGSIVMQSICSRCILPRGTSESCLSAVVGRGSIRFVRTYLVALTLGAIPLETLAQLPPVREMMYAPFVETALREYEGVELALTRDGEWLAYTSAEGVTVIAAAGGRGLAVPVPRETSCENLRWNPSGTALALRCGHALYVWRRGHATADIVSETIRNPSSTPPAWLPTGRGLLYATIAPADDQARPPVAEPARQVAVSEDHAERDLRCATVGTLGVLPQFYQVVVGECSDSVDVLRSPARQAALSGTVRSESLDAAARPSPTLIHVMLFDISSGKHTVVAAVRGEVANVLPMPDGQSLMTAAAISSDRDSWDVYLVPFSTGELPSSSTLSVDLTTDPVSLAGGIVPVLKDARVDGGPTRLVVSPTGQHVAWWGSKARQFHPAVPSADTLYLSTIQPHARPTAVALPRPRPAGGDPQHSLPWFAGYGRPPVWTPDGVYLLAVADGQLWQIDGEGRQAERLSEGLQRIVTEVLWCSDGNALVATIDPLTGRRGLWWVNLSTREWHRAHEGAHTLSVRPANMAPLSQTVAASSGPQRATTVAWVGSSLRSPPNMYTLRLEGDNRVAAKPQQVTRNTVTVSFPAIHDTVFSYRVSGNRWGTAVLVRPAAATASSPTIVTAYPGGGTVSLAAPEFGLGRWWSSADLFGAVARGYALLLVDVPMTPFGEYGPQGPAAAIVEGMTAALDAAARTGWVDMTRLGIIGHSYGGYMVNVLVTRTQRFRSAVSLAGISDLVSFTSGDDGLRRPSSTGPDRSISNNRMGKALARHQNAMY